MSGLTSMHEGEIIAGKYRVDRVLGSGGMGVVVAATHLQLDERVAIKLMLAEAAASAELVQRFVREGRAARMLKSEHVARVHDIGTLEDGTPFMVMELLEGEDLDQLISRRKRLPVIEAADYVLQACDALGEAHALDIVHRDVKPSNLFLCEGADGQPLVKILDFGISKFTSLDDSSLSMTRTRSMIGSPIYMSPEQMKSARDVDARGDVWSLGVILFELVAGRPPYIADTLGQLMAMVLSEPPPKLRDLRPDVPEAYANLVASCLERDRAERCPRVSTLARALAPFAPEARRPLVDRIEAVELKSSDPRSARTLPGVITPSSTTSSNPVLAAVRASASPAASSGVRAGVSSSPSHPEVPTVLAQSGAEVHQTATAWEGKPARSRRRTAPALAVASLVLAGVATAGFFATRPRDEAVQATRLAAPPATIRAASHAGAAAAVPFDATAPLAIDTTAKPPPRVPGPATATSPAAAPTTHPPTTATATTKPPPRQAGIFDRN